MIELENLTAVSNTQQDFLGHLMWFSVGKQLIKTDELENKLNNAGLDSIWMPNPIRSTDAFRRATKEMEQRKATSQPNVFQNVLMREVYADKEAVQRNIVVETVDQNGKRLSYSPQSAVITLDKNKDHVTFVTEDAMIEEICQEAEHKFNLYKNHYSAQQLRVMVNKNLQSLAPTPVRKNGGIYFVPAPKSPDLLKLVQFISSLDDSEGYKVPVIDSADNRTMVNEKLTEHFDSILDDCRQRGNLKKGEMKMLVGEANRVIKDYRNYKSIVTEEAQQMEQKIMQIRSEVTRIMGDRDECKH